jgi:predicted nucleotide-binding protein
MTGDRFEGFTISGGHGISIGGQGVTHNHGAVPARSDRRAEADEKASEKASAKAETAAELMADRARNVFVVYGRDWEARDALFRLLRFLDLRPLEWEKLVHATAEGSPFLGKVVADAPALAQAAVVILTPDDEVRLHPRLRHDPEDAFELRRALQPRPNVLLELGMALAAFPQRTIIVEFGTMRPFADLAGRNVIRFDAGSSPHIALKSIAGRLKNAGCPVDDRGTDWLNVAPFTAMDAYRRTARANP